MRNDFNFCLRKVLLWVVAIALSAGTCRAQFVNTGYTDANAAKSISSFAPLFEGLSRLIHDQAQAQNGVAPVWDSVQQQYRSNLLPLLCHPEIPAAGYRKFSLVEVDKLYSFGSAESFKTDELVKRAQYAVDRKDTRSAPVYEFDDSGWLRAIRQEWLNPEYEAFTQTVDSLFYDFRKDGTVQLRWQRHLHNSGRNSGYNRSECGKLPTFFQSYQENQVLVEMNALGQIIQVKSHSEERLDTCTAGGTQFLNGAMEYDADGRLTRVTQREGKGDSLRSEMKFQYTPFSLDGFNRRIAYADTFAPLREPLVQHWLQSIKGLQCLEYKESGVGFKHHDRDSPVVWNVQSTFIFLNASRQVVASVPQSGYGDFSFLIREREGKTNTPLLFLQQIPRVQTTTESGIVCKPLTLKSSIVYKKSHRLESTDTLHFSLTGSVAQELKYTSYNTTVVSSPEFVSAIPKALQYQVQSAALTNNQGLLHYLWLPEKTYVLRYE